MWRRLPTFPARECRRAVIPLLCQRRCLLNWTWLIGALSEADWLVGRLAGEGGRLLNPHILIRPFVQREAVLSSKIEGPQATLGELRAAEAGAIVDRSPEDLREVGNYVVAPEHEISRQGTRTSSRISRASPTCSCCTRQTTRNARVCRKCLHTVATICLGAIESFISL
jgi:hypothetical protein